MQPDPNSSPPAKYTREIEPRASQDRAPLPDPIGQAGPSHPAAPSARSTGPTARLAGAAAASALALSACGGGSSASNATSGATSLSNSSSTTSTAAPLTPTQASRFLAQASIGYAKSDITALANSNIDSWLTSQFAMSRPQRFWDFLIAQGYNAAANFNTYNGYDAMIWSQLMGSTDVLRQRVGMALLAQWVVSLEGIVGSWAAFAMAAYLDVLWDHAFGNYRDLMEAVSTNPAMGSYLTFLGSVKASATTGAIPDENYARELMQLFTIGLYQLNMDASLVLSGGKPVPTYTQTDVSQHARVWTGYTHANSDTSTPDNLQLPMIITASLHETGATNFIGISIPAGVDGATARKAALDGLFQHPNVPPFVSKQLIQHLVTSNPSPAYIQRVAQVFANNGSGVRGDMMAVIRAVLTDSEARDDTQVSSNSFGKLREPVMRLVHWAKAFHVSSPSQTWAFGNTSSSANRLAESPGHAPSVFNWFRPGYTPPGTALAAAGLVAPELQITDEPGLIAYVNFMQQLIVNGAGDALPDYSALTALAPNSQALLDELNLVLAANQISAASISRIKSALDTLSSSTSAGIQNRICAAIMLVMASPEYLVVR